MITAIEIKNVCKSIKRKHILNNISFSIGYGDILGVIGKNGAGKTSLLKCIVGLWKCDKGSVIFNKKCKLSAIIEYPSLFDDMTLIENIEYYGILSHTDYKNKAQNLIGTLKLESAKNEKIKTFSSGMKQKACLIIALMQQPDILILDEPISMIDPISATEITEFLKKLYKTNMAIIISSHNLNDISNLCNKILILNNGEIEDYFPYDNKIKKYILSPTNESEYKRIIRNSNGFNISQDGNKIILCGDANSLTEYLSAVKPVLDNIEFKTSLDYDFTAYEQK